MTDKPIVHHRCAASWQLYYRMIYSDHLQSDVNLYIEHLENCKDCAAWLADFRSMGKTLDEKNLNGETDV